MPNNRHRHPPIEEALREDIVPVQRQRPQHDGDQHVDDEVRAGDLEPPVDMPERLVVEGVHYFVERDRPVARRWRGGLAGDGRALLGVGRGSGLVHGVAAGQRGLQRAARGALVLDEVDAQELAPVEAVGPEEGDDDRVEAGREERDDGAVQARDLQLRGLDVDGAGPEPGQGEPGGEAGEEPEDGAQDGGELGLAVPEEREDDGQDPGAGDDGPEVRGPVVGGAGVLEHYGEAGHEAAVEDHAPVADLKDPAVGCARVDVRAEEIKRDDTADGNHGG